MFQKMINVLMLGLVFCLSGSVSAAMITWSGPFNTVGPADVVAEGLLLESVNASATTGEVVVNGVTFTNSNDLLANSAAAGMLAGNTTGDADYDTMLNVVDYGGGTAPNLLVGGGNLLAGTEYMIQVWYTDLRTAQMNRVMTMGDGLGNTVDLNANEGGFGQYAIGMFKADSTGSQTLSLVTNGFGNAHITAYQIRTVPNVRLAVGPVPSDTATDVLRDSQLVWTPGRYAATHNVYVGESFEDVNSANVPSSLEQDITSFDPGRLEYGKTIFWRVDEVNGTPDKTVFKGNIWGFTVEPYSIQIPVDVNHVTASSFSSLNPPDMTVNGSGLTGNTHSTDGEAMWLSAPDDSSPWLMYEFDQAQTLDQMLIWNSNSNSEGFVGWGLKDVNIQTSMNGVDWTVVVESSQIDRAPGLPTYDAPHAIDLGLALAKYVRINILSNWGGLLKQYGVSEVQFYGLPVYARTPDPVSGSEDVRPDSVVTWRTGRQAAQHMIIMGQDANAVADGSAPAVSSSTNSLNLGAFDPQLGQTYYWRVDEVNEAEVPSVWAGSVWSFTTSATLTVDDFESYSNLSPNRPFQTWRDGFGYSADEFFPVTYGGNGTGAGIGHDIWSPGSLYFDGTIMETGNTLPGSSQSMPFYYTNTNGVASQTERTFAEPQDWTIGGVKTLSIAFFGQADNTGTLYVKINNTKVTYPHDPTNIARDSWQAWNIDLSSLNVQAVTTLQIGVDGAGASGMILIDDIKLYPTASELLTPVAPTGDNLVGQWKFDEGSGTVAKDSSSHGYNGTIVDGTWEAGPMGSALVFNGISSQVSLPAAAWDTIEQQVTVCFWAYVDPLLVQTPITFAAYQDLAVNNSRVINVHLVYSGTLYFDAGGDAGGYDRISAPASASDYGDAWIHWAFTKNAETGEMKVYRNGMLWLSGTGQTRSMTGVTDFTLGAKDNTGFWNGSMDEFQLYNKELTQDKILWLAGERDSMDKLF